MPDGVQDAGHPAFGDLGRHYPEKTYYLGRVFADTTNSYKLIWFLAVLALAERTIQQSMRLRDVLIEMAVLAWPPVCLYRLLA